MIHAITCSFVLTSGAGTSFSGPMASMISATYRRVNDSSSRLDSRGIADDSPLTTAERHVCDRTFPGHPRGERRDLVERHVGVITDPAFRRTERDVVLHAVSGEDF